jgi:hypothetical protein
MLRLPATVQKREPLQRVTFEAAIHVFSYQIQNARNSYSVRLSPSSHACHQNSMADPDADANANTNANANVVDRLNLHHDDCRPQRLE